MPELSLPEKYWYLPYGDDDNDIYKENAIRASTLNDDIKSQGWSGLVLKNSSGDYSDTAIENIHPSYDSISDLLMTYKKFKGKWTEIADMIPYIKNYIISEIEPYLFVGHAYILKIEAKGYIKEHRDIPANYDENIHNNYNTLNTFMIPLNNPSSSYFIHNKKQMPLESHKATWFNSSLPHVYFNTSNESKYFLLFTGLARKNWIQMTVGNMLK